MSISAFNNWKWLKRSFAMISFFFCSFNFTLAFGHLDESYADRMDREVTYHTNDNFRFGTYIIDKPGVYRLKDDISFIPDSPDVLIQAINNGTIPSDTVAALGLPNPVDAYHAGSRYVVLRDSYISGLKASYGSAYGVDIFTNSKHVHVKRVEVSDMAAGLADPSVFYDGPNELPRAIGFHIGEETEAIRLRNICADSSQGIGGEFVVDDWSERARIRKVCR